MVKHDFKLEACLRTFEGIPDAPEPAVQAIKGVRDAFDRNSRRINELILFPFAVVAFTAHAQRVAVEADRITKGVDPARRRAEAQKLMNKEIIRRARLFSSGGEKAEAAKKVEETIAVLGIQNIARDVPAGTEAWLSSMIVGTWTAIESMAEDFWEAALNASPRGLAELKGRRSKGQRVSSRGSSPISGEDERTDQKKQVGLQWLQKYGYDASKKMGTIQKERYQFDSLSGIRSAYSEAFFEDYKEIDSAINDRQLDALSVVRNNIVHNGGIIGHQYLKRRSILPPHAVGNVGDPIPIDGEFVSSLIRPAILNGRHFSKLWMTG
jgi:hypothetical protein